jgi:5-methylcytosine-specific restriction endonuclease McrA
MRYCKINQIVAHLQLHNRDGYDKWLYQKYTKEMMSSHEIHEYIMSQMPQWFEYNVKSVQRAVKNALLRHGGELRSRSDAFKIAIDKGRMDYEHQRKVHKIKRISLKPSRRYEVLKRDGFMCVLCGAKASETVALEVDHLIPVCNGGKHTADNLRTLCWNCNTGKRIVEKER